MNSKEFLQRAYRVYHKICGMVACLETLRESTQRLTMAYGTECVSHTPNPSSTQDIILCMVEKQKEIKGELDRLLNLKAEISEVIARVREPEYRMVLEKRYLFFETWAQIANELHYSSRWVRTLHERALKEIEGCFGRG